MMSPYGTIIRYRLLRKKLLKCDLRSFVKSGLWCKVRKVFLTLLLYGVLNHIQIIVGIQNFSGPSLNNTMYEIRRSLWQLRVFGSIIELYVVY